MSYGTQAKIFQVFITLEMQYFVFHLLQKLLFLLFSIIIRQNRFLLGVTHKVKY